jgi:hypothetical protein
MDKSSAFRFKKGTTQLLHSLAELCTIELNLKWPQYTWWNIKHKYYYYVSIKNLHSHRLQLPARHSDIILVLVVIFQLRPETELVCSL